MQICDCCVNRLWQHLPARMLSESQAAPSGASEPAAMCKRGDWLLNITYIIDKHTNVLFTYNTCLCIVLSLLSQTDTCVIKCASVYIRLEGCSQAAVLVFITLLVGIENRF